MGFDQLSTKILISKTLSSKERIKPVPKYEGEYHLVCYCVIWCVSVSSGVLLCSGQRKGEFAGGEEKPSPSNLQSSF